MSNTFNTYCVLIGQQLASKIPPPVHHTYPVKVNGPKNSFALHDTFVEEVNVVINNLLVSKSNRQNDIPTHILKLCKNSISPFLVQIFNFCIREGTHPQSLKCAQVVPIYEGGPKDLCTNYTPISLLSPINIIFEKLIYSRLYTYLEQNSMLSSHQYVFQMGLSTTLAIYYMQENILENLEKGFITCTIFCGLSKAFDTIGHDVLLWKLDNCFGIRGLPIKLLASYLQGRQQYTVIDG